MFIFSQVASAFPGIPLVPCGKSGEAPCNICQLYQLGHNIISFVALGLVPIIAVVLFTIAGILILFGGATPGTLARGKKIFTTTFFGMLIMYAAWMITNTVIKTLYDGNSAGDGWGQFTCTTTVYTAEFGCVNGQCVLQAGGTFTEPTCGGTCTGTTSGPPPTTSVCKYGSVPSNSSGCGGSGQPSCVSAQPCSGTNGACLLAPQANTSFNDLKTKLAQANGSCSLTITQTFQQNSQSQSTCHSPGNVDTGTCLDARLSNYSTCIGVLFSIAPQTAAKFILDEYNPACTTSNTSAGHVHIAF